MTTAYLALCGFVKSPLMPQWWRAAMASFEPHKWVTSICAAVAAAFIVGQSLFGAGGWWGGQSHDISALQAQQNIMASQLSSLQAQVSPLARLPDLIDKLNARMDAAPRADLLGNELTEIQRHLSALDGRMDGMDTRARADEDRIIRDDTRIDAIDNASKATLGHR